MAGLLAKVRRLWDHYRPLRERFGDVAGTRMGWALGNANYRRPAGELVAVAVPGWARPVMLRARTSDSDVFQQVLVHGELELVLASPVRRIIDGGANIGLASLVFAHRWPSAEIVAIELERNNFELAQVNCANVPTIHLRHAALWDRSGQVAVVNPDGEEHSFRAGGSDAPGAVRAYRISELLDELGWDTVDLIKLDIEGAERRVLQDSAAWLPRVRHLLVELHDRFEPGCTAAFEAALAGDDWDVQAQGEYMLASRRAG